MVDFIVTEIREEPPAPKKQAKKFMNFCPSCRNQLKHGKFCTNCGSNLS